MAAMISSAGSPRKSKPRIARHTSSVSGQTWMRESVRISSGSSRSTSIRPSSASFPISHRTMEAMLHGSRPKRATSSWERGGAQRGPLHPVEQRQAPRLELGGGDGLHGPTHNRSEIVSTGSAWPSGSTRFLNETRGGRCDPDLAAPDLPIFGRQQGDGGGLCRLDLAAALGPSSVARLVLPHQGSLCLGVESRLVAPWRPWHAGRVTTVTLQGKALEGQT